MHRSPPIHRYASIGIQIVALILLLSIETFFLGTNQSLQFHSSSTFSEFGTEFEAMQIFGRQKIIDTARIKGFPSASVTCPTGFSEKLRYRVLFEADFQIWFERVVLSNSDSHGILNDLREKSKALSF